MWKILGIAAVGLVLAGCSGGSSTSTGNSGVVVSSQCCGWQAENSPGVVLAQVVQGVQFAFPVNPNHVNIVVGGVSGAKKTGVAATYEVTGSAPQFAFVPEATNTCGGPATVQLYFQQAGDDFSGAGVKQYYRWWSTARQTLALGAQNWVVNFDPSLWSSVLGVRGDSSVVATQGFAAALNGMQWAGFTFGGGCFAGHGVWLNGGIAVFSIEGFTVQ